MASPLGKLSRQRLKGQLLASATLLAENHSIRVLDASFIFHQRHCLQLSLSALRATFPQGDSSPARGASPRSWRISNGCVASPLGKLSRKRLKGQLLALATLLAENHSHPCTQCVFHLSPTPLPATSPFGPAGHFPPRGQLSSTRRPLRETGVSATDVWRPLWGSCRVSD